MNSKPCSMCCDMIRKAGIKTVMYSDTNGSIIKLKSHELDDTHVSKGIKLICRISEQYFRKKIHKLQRGINNKNK